MLILVILQWYEMSINLAYIRFQGPGKRTEFVNSSACFKYQLLPMQRPTTKKITNKYFTILKIDYCQSVIVSTPIVDIISEINYWYNFKLSNLQNTVNEFMTQISTWVNTLKIYNISLQNMCNNSPRIMLIYSILSTYYVPTTMH